MNLFTYGTLMENSIWKSIVKNKHKSTSACVKNHTRRKLKKQTYPALVPAANQAVKGVVYYNLKRNELKKLDIFEGYEYKRILIETSACNPCFVYVYKPKLKNRLLKQEWSLDEFKQSGAKMEFVRAFKGWQQIAEL